MKNKIFKWTLLSGAGLTASALTSSLGLMTANIQSKTSNFTPPPRQSIFNI